MDNLPQRKKLRIQGYDYSLPGYYFVTICAKDRLNLFGSVVGADDPVRPQTVQSNNIGKIIYKCWTEIDRIYPDIKTDAFCLMPNHIHGIIRISESCGQGRPPLQKIMQGYKSVPTRLCFKYDYRIIWQRGYHEHIIRDESELLRIREYIFNNPARWLKDKYYI